MEHAIEFVFSKLWRWDVAGAGSVTLYGLGAAAMSSGQYIIAACLYFTAVAWLAAKFVAWEEVRRHESKKLISTFILVLAVVLFGLSLLWEKHTMQVETAKAISPPSASQTSNGVPPQIHPPTNTGGQTSAESPTLDKRPTATPKHGNVSAPQRPDQPPIVIETAPTFGNLADRAKSLCKDIMEKLYFHGWGKDDWDTCTNDPMFWQAQRMNPFPEKMPHTEPQEDIWEKKRSDFYRINFLARAIALRNEFAQLHMIDDELDLELGVQQLQAQRGGVIIVVGQDEVAHKFLDFANRIAQTH